MLLLFVCLVSFHLFIWFFIFSVLKESQEVTSNVSTEIVIQELKRKLDLANKKILKLTEQNAYLSERIRKIFSEDQVKAMQNPSKSITWSDDAIQKSLKLRLACGNNGYNYMIESGYPLPSVRTLQRKISGFLLEPGISIRSSKSFKSKDTNNIADRTSCCFNDR